RGLVQGTLAALASSRVPHLARPTDELRVAVVGLNGRGAEHIAALARLPGVRIVALCDVDDHVLAREARKLRARELGPGLRGPGLHVDFRRVLEREDVDAVTLATPDHWHALQAIWACQAGKDVFVESPVTHAFAEGARVVTAAEKFARIVQSGYPARASPARSATLEWVRAANLGPFELVRALCYEPRPSLGQTRDNRHVPQLIDYDLWCGPGPLLPLRRARLHHDWRWLFAYGEGELGGGAAHALDLARWAIGAEGLPATVLSVGGRFGYEDDGETPNTQLVYYAFEPVPILLEIRGLPASRAAQTADWSVGMDDTLGVRVGAVVHCAHGTLRIHLDSLAIACDDHGKEIRRWEGAGDPFASWIEALKSRRSEDLTSGIEAGARSSGLVHLASAAHRAGQSLGRDEVVQQLASLATLTATGQRMLAHLDQNGVDLPQARFAMSPRLALDPEQGRFVGDERANALLAASYREPYVLPVV
ncbi:MAG: Gfo/Idh/MocA family oxidoreductase, partial [Planctomycetes bacterium]|nr:Gfo/Idh/MocA family oxidoreductase [Planctomycetota bacterium]